MCRNLSLWCVIVSSHRNLSLSPTSFPPPPLCSSTVPSPLYHRVSSSYRLVTFPFALLSSFYLLVFLDRSLTFLSPNIIILSSRNLSLCSTVVALPPCVSQSLPLSFYHCVSLFYRLKLSLCATLFPSLPSVSRPFRLAFLATCFIMSSSRNLSLCLALFPPPPCLFIIVYHHSIAS